MPTADTPAAEPTLAEYIRAENAKDIQRAAGDTVEVVPEVKPVDLKAVDPEPKPDEPEPEPEGDRNADGTFKAKPKDDQYGGDPRKSHAAKVNYYKKLAAQADRRAEAAEARLAASTSPVAPEAAAPASAATPTVERKAPTYLALVKKYEADPEFPQLADFVEAGFTDPYQACNAAIAAFLQDKRTAEREATTAAEKAEQAFAETRKAANDAGREKYTDWDDLLESEAAQIDLPGVVIRELYEDPATSADLIHHLMTHPEAVASLAKISDPIAAARAIAKLSTALTAAPAGPAEKPPSVTKARPLIKPVKASPAAPEVASTADLPLSKYIQAENARERREDAARRGA